MLPPGLAGSLDPARGIVPETSISSSTVGEAPGGLPWDTNPTRQRGSSSGPARTSGDPRWRIGWYPDEAGGGYAVDSLRGPNKMRRVPCCWLADPHLVFPSWDERRSLHHGPRIEDD